MSYDQENKGHFSKRLMSEKIFSNRKIFFLDLKENDRGRVVKITEDVNGRRDTIMVPVSSCVDFIEALQRIVDFEGKTPYDNEENR